MNIDLTKLIYGQENQLLIDEQIKIPDDLLAETEVRKISDVHVNGVIFSNGEEYDLNVTISGIMVLGCARTLKDVNYPFEIEIGEVISETEDDSLEIVQNRVDIFPIIWQYILVDVPLRVLHPDAKDERLEGSGWCLITEDEQEEVIDPRLAKLKEYVEE